MSLELQLQQLMSYKAIDDVLHGVQLHPCQCADIIKMLFIKKCIVIYPTGTGKTLLASAVIKMLIKENPKRRFLIFGKKDQLIQTPQKIKNYSNLDVLSFSASAKDLQVFTLDNVRKYKVILATHDCLFNKTFTNKLYDMREEFTGIIIDEAHELSNINKAERASMIAAIATKFEYVYALTATPITTSCAQIARLATLIDGKRYPNASKLLKNLEGGKFNISEDPLFFINRKDEELGRNCHVKGLILPVEPMPHQMKVTGGPQMFQILKGDGAFNQATALANLVQSLKGKRGLIYVNQHSVRNWIMPFLEDTGIRTAYINGFTTAKSRADIMHHFNILQDIDVVITSVTTAIDLDCDYVIFYEFTSLVEQMIGRAVRGLNSKEIVVYFVITQVKEEIEYFLNNIYSNSLLVKQILDKQNEAVRQASEQLLEVCR